MQTQELTRGFADPVFAAQGVFRAAMWALSRPGRPQELPTDLVPPAPLSPEAAALALTLCDYETPVFLDAALAADRAVSDFLRFHTGAPIVAQPGEARFAFIANPLNILDFSEFSLGSPDFPDASVTLILQVAGFVDRGFTLEGPGIKGRIGFGAAPLPEHFAARMAANRALFPRGVDLLLAGAGQVIGLPRSVAVQEG
ncbi:alpha-D-ribose 1-methylphosphonate 5-triphosphate synthase subunit PhnH [Ancylobacter sp. 3268]|uniref:phosphonate C-P lyase system protein PhnH n=1 Tax=Ancylobacter sp. 3268 TaxID=2817752 RepID=UPI002855C45C|nr:phosphonate C-P lyase system protein PhnH [Ancylobacter sp. 3268]MDR6951687.1 alpha-D-ribose 1-methylphosphonate 5-triphosphate synthase subunit PhnH [Ancylobacter sp. 3268]